MDDWKEVRQAFLDRSPHRENEEANSLLIGVFLLGLVSSFPAEQYSELKEWIKRGINLAKGGVGEKDFYSKEVVSQLIRYIPGEEDDWSDLSPFWENSTQCTLLLLGHGEMSSRQKFETCTEIVIEAFDSAGLLEFPDVGGYPADSQIVSVPMVRAAIFELLTSVETAEDDINESLVLAENSGKELGVRILSSVSS